MNSASINPTQIIHLTRSIGPTSFGVGQVALNLAISQVQSGLRACIWSLDSREIADSVTKENHCPIGLIRGFPVSPPSSLGLSRAMEESARSERFSSPVVVHQHMIWLGYSRIPALVKVNNTAKVVIAPHGALDDWALKKSAWKKFLAGRFYERRNLLGADCIQATSEREITNIRDFGLGNPIALIPNGVSQALLDSSGHGPDFRARFDISNDKRIMLFISRIAPQKGLLMMLDALNRVRSQLDDWVFVIGGSDQDGHEREVMARVEQLGLQAHVAFVGPLFGQIKLDAFDASELFVLPSHCEGSPMIVLEALSCGVPVITTKAAAWSELERTGCGWCCDISIDGLCGALKEAFMRSHKELGDMRNRARCLVARNYTWASAVQRTASLYGWLHGTIDKPDFVILD